MPLWKKIREIKLSKDFIIRFYVNPHLSTGFIDFFTHSSQLFFALNLNVRCQAKKSILVMVQNILIEISSFFQWMRFFFLHLFFIFIKDTCQERFSILKKEDNILLCRLFSSNTISAIFQMLQFHNTINIIFCVEGEMMIFFLYLKLKTTCNDFQRKKRKARKQVFY